MIFFYFHSAWKTENLFHVWHDIFSIDYFRLIVVKIIGISRSQRGVPAPYFLDFFRAIHYNIYRNFCVSARCLRLSPQAFFSLHQFFYFLRQRFIYTLLKFFSKIPAFPTVLVTNVRFMKVAAYCLISFFPAERTMCICIYFYFFPAGKCQYFAHGYFFFTLCFFCNFFIRYSSSVWYIASRSSL